MTTATHNYGWLMPDPGGSANTWGNTLNGTTQAIDAQVRSINNQVTPNTLNVWRGPDGGAYGAIDFLNPAATQARWRLAETSEPEGAGNTGTNFVLGAYDNNGVFLGNVFEAYRGTQVVSFSQAVTVAGALSANGITSTNGGMIAQATGGGNSSFEMAATGGANMGLLFWNSASNAITLNNQTGGGSLSITSDGATRVNNGFLYNQAVGSGNSNYYFTRSDGVNVGVAYYITASNTLSLLNEIGNGQVTLDGVANFTINGAAFKPGGGAWVATSDARIKTVTGAYSAGLEQVAKLNPVRFVYKGNDGDPHALVAKSRKEFIGLVADEAMRTMPEMVSLNEGEIDGRKVNDLKSLDPTALLYALVNCVKELKAEIEELKASR